MHYISNKVPELMNPLLYLLDFFDSFIPVTSDETVRSVITPSVTLAGTQSMSIQNETQEIATIKIEGKKL